MAAQRSSGLKTKKAPLKKAAGKPKKAAKVVKKAVAKPVVAAKVSAKVVAQPLQKASKPVMRGEGAGNKTSLSTVNGAKPVKKEASRLSKADMTHFRDLLLEKRREILGDVGSMESEAFKSGSNLSNMPIHMADVGTDNFEQEFTLGLIESERQILREIQEALLRIENGTYAVCIATGKPISKMRLEAVPWAKYTMEHARALEQGLLRRDPSQDDDEESGGGDEDEE
jgi:RNA polymerase-binding transcription factor DksA